ncbi:MAG: ABC transporter ATP-binding protein [Nocardioides sp.]|uniref:ABC transporter ATP-binding protein n=1 Tax=Nocardioides sp. TaxID=35761 RepID=UPI003D6AA75A
MREELLRLEGVARTVELPDGQDLHILTSVDLEVRRGDHIGIIGRSGTGKSTLLNLLGLLDRPTGGSLHWAGKDLSAIGNRAAARIRGRDIGFVFQQFNLLPGRTAIENVMAPLLYATGREFWQRRRIASEMLDQVGLGDRLDAMPHHMSGGEQQRIAIARALVRRPSVVLADEPTGALDVETGELVMNLLDKATYDSGAALITITHDPSVAAMARRHYRLAEGELHVLDEVTA